MESTPDWTAVPISSLGLSPRAFRKAERVGASTVAELCDVTEDELLATSGFGETSLREISATLAQLGLRLRSSEEPAKFPRQIRRPQSYTPLPGTELERVLNQSLIELELSAGAVHTLESEGIATLRDLVIRTGEELLEVPGIDAAVLGQIVERLAQRSLTLGMRPRTS